MKNLKFKNKQMNIWGEIRNDYDEDGLIFIDAWETADDNEEGVVIAKVNPKTGDIEYLDTRAKTDQNAQEVIMDTLKRGVV